MPQEWGYAAAGVVNAFDTENLATQGNFIVRSLFSTNGTLIPNIQHVRSGDRIRLYYRQPHNRLRLLAVLTILPGNEAHHVVVDPRVPSIYLFNDKAAEPNILRIVGQYQQDQVLHHPCGFVVRATPEDQAVLAQYLNQYPSMPSRSTLFLIDDRNGYHRQGF